MKTLSRAHGMDRATWERHANPLSGWTRIPILPLLVLAIWGRAWIGWWCLLPIAVLIAWALVNPRAFPPPSSTDNWTSKAVMGERVWLNRAEVPIPHHHARMISILIGVSAIGVPPLVWGLWQLQVWPTLLGLTLVLGGKMWFLDRMAWLFSYMADKHDDYNAWLR